MHWTSCCDCLVFGRSTCASDSCNLLVCTPNQANDRCRFISLNLTKYLAQLYLTRDLELFWLVVSVEHYLCFYFWLDVQQNVCCRPYFGRYSLHIHAQTLVRWASLSVLLAPLPVVRWRQCLYSSVPDLWPAMNIPIWCSFIHASSDLQWALCSIKSWNSYFARLVTALKTAGRVLEFTWALTRLSLPRWRGPRLLEKVAGD